MGIFDDISFDPYSGADAVGVLPDVSMSEPAQQPTTPTGNGYGYYVDPSPSWVNGLFGSLQTALNYAIVRDQQAIAQKTGTVYAGTPLVATPAANVAAQNRRFLTLGALGIGAVFLLKGK